MRPSFRFEPVGNGDFEALLALRIEVMRESLERIRRFDLQRARERFATTFKPQHTRRIVVRDELAGCVATWPEGDAIRLEHFYITAAHQGHGLGSAVVDALLHEPAQAGKPVLVGALRGSDANRFYQRHGFVPVAAGNWDIDYARPASA